MHQSNIHKYKSSELPVCTILYIYTPLHVQERLRPYTVGLVNFTPYEKGRTGGSELEAVHEKGQVESIN